MTAAAWRFLIPLFIFLNASASSQVRHRAPPTLVCYDGTDCDVGTPNTCGYCQGQLCLRITRPHAKRGWSTALTCMPDPGHGYYPEGCRTEPVARETVCVCSKGNLCNGGVSRPSYLSLLVVALSATALRSLSP